MQPGDLLYYARPFPFLIGKVLTVWEPKYKLVNEAGVPFPFLIGKVLTLPRQDTQS